MTVTYSDLDIYQGDTPVWVVSVLDDSGAPVDITGYTAQAQIRRAPADKDPLVAAQIHAVVAESMVHLSLTSAQTDALNGKYVWDLQLTGAVGEITTILTGKVNVKPGVTREAAA